MFYGLVKETDKNWVEQSLCCSAGVTGTSVISVPLWGPLFDLTGNYVLGVSLVPEMLTSMRIATGMWEDSYHGVGRRLCLKWLVWGKGMFTPLLRRTE